LALWKIIIEEDEAFIPKKIEARIFQQNFALGIFLGWVGSAAMPPLR